MVISRRTFIKAVAFLVGAGIFQLRRVNTASAIKASPKAGLSKAGIGNKSSQRLGVDRDGLSRIYLSRGWTPEENVRNVIDSMGGIERFIGVNDIVVIKPNAQRFNQGMTNTDAIKGFIDLILEIPGFKGEVIIAENHQFKEDNSRGWTTEHRNGKFNLNELVQFYQENGFPNVTKYHWHNAGPVSEPLQAGGCCGKRVSGPWDGDGYVWMENCCYVSPKGRRCLMTYPIFTSSYSGITIDLKNGAWQGGKYIDRPVKFINFSALNHHTRYAGVSASVKNLMGVVDMSCGFHGDTPKDAYNVHHIGVSKAIRLLNIHWRIRKYHGRLKYWFEDYCYHDFFYTGAALGYFMKHVKFPDLNIIAAELVGWGDRKLLSKAFRARAVLASTDPVALDYVAAKEVLLPGTPPNERVKYGKTLRELHDPDVSKGPFRKFLTETHRQGIGCLDPARIKVVRLERDGEA